MIGQLCVYCYIACSIHTPSSQINVRKLSTVGAGEREIGEREGERERDREREREIGEKEREKER